MLLICDCSHYQPTLDPAAMKAAGVVGIIHQATQIMRNPSADEFYAQHKAQCLAAGLLFAAYLYFDPTDGIGQADFFLNTIGDSGDTAIAVDIEEQGIELSEIEDCILRIHDRTGIWPWVYTAKYVIDNIGGHNSDVLRNCKLWVAGSGPVVPSPWSAWLFWQSHYIDFGNETFDANDYRGTLEQLKGEWKLATPTNIPGLDVVTTISTNDIPTFTPDGVFRGMIKVGDKVTVMEGADHIKVFGGVPCIESPDDYYVPVANAPLPLPAPVAVTRYVTATGGLNVRSTPTLDAGGNPTGAITGGLAWGTAVQVIINASTGKKMDQIVSPRQGYVADWLLDTVRPH